MNPVYGKNRLPLCIFLLIIFIKLISNEVRFKNIICTPYDKNFANFEYCFLKAVNRSFGYMSLKVNLFQLPVTNVTINIALLKRENGYKPFLYNVTFDACKFMKSKNSNPVAKYLHEAYESHSNMNHSCPYNHDVIVEKLSTDFVNSRFSYLLPFPKGDYAFDSNWFAYNINRANVRVLLSLN